MSNRYVRYRLAVRAFVVDNFLYGESVELQDEDSLLGRGITDSTGVVELVTFLDSTFGVKVEDHEMLPENLDSVARIASFVERKLSSSAEQPLRSGPWNAEGADVAARVAAESTGQQ